MTLLGDLLGALAGALRTVCVCSGCVRPSDELVGPGGDFSICDRCGESITSKTGTEVRVKGRKR